MYRVILPVLLIAQLAYANFASIIRCQCNANGGTQNWALDSGFKGLYDFEKHAPSSYVALRDQFGGLVVTYLGVDSSPAINPLAPLSGTFDTTNFIQGCSSQSNSSGGTGVICGAGCDDTDFHFPGAFTVGCWERQTAAITGTFGYTLCTDCLNNNNFDGYALMHNASNQFVFRVDSNGPAIPADAVSAVTFGLNDWHHHVGRFLGGGTNSVQQIIDGVADANTASSNGVTGWQSFFQIGASSGGASDDGMIGNTDECFAYGAALTDQTVCRIAVCGIDGCKCTCDPNTPANYLSHPRHSSEGGPINCTLPACNAATPSTLTTTTSTSTTSSTSTSTSSTSSTTSTSTSSTSVSTSTSTSSTSTSTTTSTTLAGCSTLTHDQLTSSVTGVTTASVTPGSNHLILIAVASGNFGAPVAPTATGNSLTYVQVATVQSNSNLRRLTVLRGLGASPTTGTISISFGSDTQLAVVWAVIDCTGVNTTGTNGSGAVRQPTTNSGSGTSLSVTLGSFAAGTNGTFGVFGTNTNDVLTVGSGFSSLAQDTATSSFLSMLSEFKPTNDTSVDASDGNTVNWGGIALELVTP